MYTKHVWNGGIIKHIPVMMYHGDQDEIVPISESVTMLKAISKNGVMPNLNYIKKCNRIKSGCG